MALDDAQILVESYSAAKSFVRNGSLSADDKAILGGYEQEIFNHTEATVRKKFRFWILKVVIHTRRKEKMKESSTCFSTQSRLITRMPLR